MTSQASFATLIARLDKGDDDAAARITTRFARRLLALAHRQFDSVIRHKVDLEEIVQSVLKSFFLRQRKGQFVLPTWGSLWGLLVTMTVRKCAERANFLQAVKRDVRREINLPASGADRALVRLFDREPTPDEADLLAETVEQFLAGWDERDRVILKLHLEGHTLAEISEQLGWAQRTVRRVIHRARQRMRRLQAEED